VVVDRVGALVVRAASDPERQRRRGDCRSHRDLVHPRPEDAVGSAGGCAPPGCCRRTIGVIVAAGQRPSRCTCQRCPRYPLAPSGRSSSPDPTSRDAWCWLQVCPPCSCPRAGNPRGDAGVRREAMPVVADDRRPALAADEQAARLGPLHASPSSQNASFRHVIAAVSRFVARVARARDAEAAVRRRSGHADDAPRSHVSIRCRRGRRCTAQSLVHERHPAPRRSPSGAGGSRPSHLRRAYLYAVVGTGP